MPTDPAKVTALIVAAGTGSRLGGEMPKQYRSLAGKAVLAHAVDCLASHPGVAAVRVVIGAGQEQLAEAALGGREVGRLIIGGATRSDSVRAGLEAIGTCLALVHDAARPFCPHAVIDRLLAALAEGDGAVPVLPVTDTLARGDGSLDEAVDRHGLVRVQTPQAAPVAMLLDALASAGATGASDESTLLLAAGRRVVTVAGDPLLEKLTSPADWARAEALLAARLVPRTGLGFDVHAFAGNGPVMLGGVAVPYARGLAGHSDADVVLHAITDALLGAAGLGDIGTHFPPSDAQWKGASSDLFLRHAAELVRGAGGIVDHVDCTIICEAPKIGSHRAAMRTGIAGLLRIPETSVSIKATTTERLGFTGRGEGIAAQAVASIRMEPRS